MPRKYKSKSQNPYKKHDKVKLQQAVEDVKNGICSLRKAQEKYDINYSVIRRHLKGGPRMNSQGEQGSLTSNEEDLLKIEENSFPVASTSKKNDTSVSADNFCEKKNHSVFSKHLDLEDIRQLQAKFVQERNWEQYHEPRNLLLALVGEVGELSELFQWRGEVKSGLPDWSSEDKEHLGQELSDVLLYLIRLSEKCGVDLPAAVIKKIALNSEKYPVSKVWGSDKKYTAYLDKS